MTSLLTTPPEATLVIVTGAPGSGKTFWANRLEAQWPRPMVLWDQGLVPQQVRQGPGSAPPMPDMGQGLPSTLPEGWDVVVIVTSGFQGMGPQGRPGTVESLLDWCEKHTTQRALALVSTGEKRLRHLPVPSAETLTSTQDRILDGWSRRFAQTPHTRTFRLTLDAQQGATPQVDLLAWRQVLDATILRQAIDPPTGEGLAPLNRPRL